MNILNFAVKEIKESIRDKQTIIMHILFPIGLMVVLGTALSSQFNTDSTPIGKIEVAYTDNNSSELGNKFKETIESIKDIDINITEVKDRDKAISSVEKKEVDAYVDIDKEEVKLYKNERFPIGSDIFEGVVKSFVNKYNLVSTLISEDINAINNIEDTPKDYITSTSLNKERSPSSIDYYGVTITLMIGLFSSMSSVEVFTRERIQNTENRILSSPVKKHEIFIGKILGVLALGYVFSLIVFFIAKYALNAYFGENPIMFLVILLSEVMMFISLGIVVGYIGRTPGASMAIMNILVQIISFLGGAYVPLGDLFSNGKSILNIIPLYWNINSSFSFIYDNNALEAVKAIGMNVGVAVLLVIIASVISRKREGI